jgi:hypothetical protein
MTLRIALNEEKNSKEIRSPADGGDNNYDTDIQLKNLVCGWVR